MGTLNINLEPSKTSYSLEVYGPIFLIIDPQKAALGLNKKVYKISYNFDKGHPPLVKKILQEFRQDFTAAPFSLELSDPRNFVVSEEYLPVSTEDKIYNITILVEWFGDPSTSEENNLLYTIELKVKPPILSLSAIETQSNFFEDIHLISSRMFGSNNTLIYSFEGLNPTYLLPVVVNWNRKDKPQLNLQPPNDFNFKPLILNKP